MSRPRRRACLESGLKLDLNRLIRQGVVRPGAISEFVYSWTNNYTGEETARALVTANLIDQPEGWLRIRNGESDQRIFLVPRSRRFGGHQWYFICPVTNRCASVLWKPPGVSRFCSRQSWGSRRVAYHSQFLDLDSRAHRGKAKIKSRLIADLDPDEWDLPPKPKRMRWRTYNRYVKRFDKYEDILADGIVELVAKLLAK